MGVGFITELIQLVLGYLKAIGLDHIIRIMSFSEYQKDCKKKIKMLARGATTANADENHKEELFENVTKSDAINAL